MNRKTKRGTAQQRRNALLVVALMLVVCIASIGGTIAWLQDSTDEVKNTFTPSNIGLTLTETGATDTDNDKVFTKEYKMVPGDTLTKDPKVTVAANSEASWVFVEVTESIGKIPYGDEATEEKPNYTFDQFLSYTVDGAKWTLLGDDYPNVYYRKQAATTSEVELNILTNDQVTVKTNVTKEMMDALGTNAANYPKLTFKAYAIQQANIATDKTTDAEKALAAWRTINTTN